MNKVERKTHPMLDESLVSGLPMFDKLDRRQIRDVLDLATVRRVKANAAYFHEGEKADTFYMLLDGFVRMTRITKEGEQVIALHVPPGQMFGIAKAIERSTYSTTALAASEGLVLSWSTEQWEHFARDYPAFLSVTNRTVGNRMAELQDKVVEMATKHVEQRIAQTLLRLVRMASKETDQGFEIAFPLSRQDISEMTGTTLHSVSRFMSGWQKSGIVASTRRRVVICKPDDLAQMAEGLAA